ILIGVDREIWQMEVSGPPSTSTNHHTVGDTKKSIQTDILNLVGVLSNHLDLDVKIAKDIKVFSTQVIGILTMYAFSMQEDGIFFTYELVSAELPFDFHSRSKYMAVFRLMAIFHDEIVQQKAIMDKIDRILVPCEGKCVRDVLKIPAYLRDI
ncbi:14612_t:CDS:2, partial [Funneliformis mosseae]